jgi:putative transposase
LSLRRQCRLLEVPWSSCHYQPAAESPENLALMRRLDELYLATPFYGSRKFAVTLGVNRKRVQRLMRLLGLEALYPKRRTTQSSPEHRKYPYLLRNVEVQRCDQVWSADITYVPLARGYLYLAAVLDWHSRYVLAWRLSNTLEGSFCLEALQAALAEGRPAIFNTDQGVQFTSVAFTGCLEEAGVQISMDGRGRALDNVFIERLWRSVKYEEVYPRRYTDGHDAAASLGRYFTFYNKQRVHQALGYRTPAAVYQPRGGGTDKHRCSWKRSSDSVSAGGR